MRRSVDRCATDPDWDLNAISADSEKGRFFLEWSGLECRFSFNGQAFLVSTHYNGAPFWGRTTVSKFDKETFPVAESGDTQGLQEFHHPEAHAL